jgi:hypothetical protein
MAQSTRLTPLADMETPVTVITPSHGWVALRLGKVWEYRELLYFLAWRDIKIRYKQTILGAAWAVIQPGVAQRFLQKRPYDRDGASWEQQPVQACVRTSWKVCCNVALI